MKELAAPSLCGPRKISYRGDFPCKAHNLKLWHGSIRFTNWRSSLKWGLGYSHFMEKLSFAGMAQSLIGEAHFALQNGEAH